MDLLFGYLVEWLICLFVCLVGWLVGWLVSVSLNLLAPELFF
jgi:hypothetical protein